MFALILLAVLSSINTSKILFIKGDWGLGIGDWGLGIGDWAPIPNPQSPIPNPQSPIIKDEKLYVFK